MRSLLTASAASLALASCAAPPMCALISRVELAPEAARAVVEIDRPGAEAIARNNALLDRACR